MSRHTVHDNATSNLLAWSHHAANVEAAADEEGAADVDEPPDSITHPHRLSPDFRRTSVTKTRENHASLLTRALHSASEGETGDQVSTHSTNGWRRRRSITSDISVASTADLTSDTGVSTPARTNSPSPRLLGLGFVPLSLEKHNGVPVQIAGSLPRRNVPAYPLRKEQVKPETTSTEAPKDLAVQAIEKKRCISFACAAKPKDDSANKVPQQAAPRPTTQTATSSQQPTQPRKPCIRFACPAQPARPAVQQTPPQKERLVIPRTDESGSLSTVVSTPSTVRKARSPVNRRARPLTPRGPRKISRSPAATRKKKYFTASTDEIQGENLHFHEFASDHLQQEDWIRQEAAVAKTKLTIDDLLKKENDIRRLGKEAEEEAEQEEEEAEEADDDDNGDDDDDLDNGEEDDDLEEVEDDRSGYGSDDDFSDGYNTDEDLGFAESDDDDDDGLLLWTLTTSQSLQGRMSEATPVFRPSSLGARSDSSDCSKKITRTKHTQQRSTARAATPELPDSTDFVCGTMDEDRPLEDAYATRLAARKQGKYRTIPQDIDPSFPTSEPEDDVDDNHHHSHDSGEPLWLHGELEELHDDRPDRRRRKAETSPKRLRSPAPVKRYHSPPPKARGRSPRRLFDRSSPRRIKSPAPVAMPKSPMGSLAQATGALGFAARPGLTHTKSLPRAAYFPAHIKSGKRHRANHVATKDTGHVRGAIDIVKGLEQKRQRRKEKYYQKYCHRARKGQIPEKRPRAGEGAERMRELGLLMAGKIDQGNYVLSI